jgi:pimeloyl-ACP methyl ester carboxylesterase
MADVVANGVRFHVQRLSPPGGTDRTVVFLHGLVMDNLSSWYFTVGTAAARTSDVVLYDLRGHGLSERPAEGYALADMVADLDAMLLAQGIDHPVVLVGNSFGGLLALTYALAFPEKVRGLVLVDAHLGDDAFGGEMAATLSLDGDERDKVIAQTFASWLGRHSERKRNRLAENAAALVRRTSLVEDLRRTPPVASDALASVQAPTLAIYGERSDLREKGELFLRRMPALRLQIMPGCSHSVLWEATDDVRRQILDFLEQT